MESVLSLLRDDGVTHLGCATDHVIRSWRNDRYAGYKTEEGMPPELLTQFELVEEALIALGVVVWPMVEFEADDLPDALDKLAGYFFFMRLKAVYGDLMDDEKSNWPFAPNSSIELYRTDLGVEEE